MTRTQSREQAFKLVFNKLFNKELTTEDILVNMQMSGEYKPSEFSRDLFEGVCENIEAIDTLISKNLVNWDFSRISKPVLAVLELSIYEILYREDIPDAVSINEAVELSKVYCNDQDPSFVNGILGSISRSK